MAATLPLDKRPSDRSSARRRDLASQSFLHVQLQYRVRHEFGRLWPLRCAIGVPLCRMGSVLKAAAACGRVAPQLTRDCRSRPSSAVVRSPERSLHERAPARSARALRRIGNGGSGADDARFDGGMPPHCRNHRFPTAGDTPAMAAASSLEYPWAIALQNGHRCARCNIGGRPGERSFARSDRFDFKLFDFINTSNQEVLQRWVESTQYVSIRYSERLGEADIEPSVGSKGDSYDNALAETINGLYKAELIHRRAPWKTKESVELATLEWVSWFNSQRLLEPIGYIPPAEAEANYYRQLASQASTVAA